MNMVPCKTNIKTQQEYQVNNFENLAIFRLSEADRRASFDEYDEFSRDAEDMTVEETRKCQST